MGKRAALDAKDVETAGRIFRPAAAKAIVSRRLADPAPLPTVYGFQRMHGRAFPTVFHFHKYQVVSLPGNDIDFTKLAAEVPLQDLVALLL